MSSKPKIRIRLNLLSTSWGKAQLVSLILFSFENVRDYCGATSTNILGHTEPCAVNLGFPSFSTELLSYLNDLIYSGGSYRMTSSF
jgi:hypothetical protein